MRTAHTRGPDCDVCEGFCLHTPVSVMNILKATDDHLQALMHYGQSRDLRMAMSAVQELLVVLQTIVRVADGRQVPGHLIVDENSPLMGAARDAIAMATGATS